MSSAAGGVELRGLVSTDYTGLPASVWSNGHDLATLCKTVYAALHTGDQYPWHAWPDHPRSTQAPVTNCKVP